MNGEKKGLLLQTTKQINIGAGISGVGFLLYLAASALKIQLAADVISIIFALSLIHISEPTRPETEQGGCQLQPAVGDRGADDFTGGLCCADDQSAV